MINAGHLRRKPARLLALTLLLVLGVAIAAVLTAKVRARTSCRAGHPSAPTPAQALAKYYRSCHPSPHLEKVDANQPTSAYARWDGLIEYAAAYPDRLRWVMVGRRQAATRGRCSTQRQA